MEGSSRFVQLVITLTVTAPKRRIALALMYMTIKQRLTYSLTSLKSPGQYYLLDTRSFI